LCVYRRRWSTRHGESIAATAILVYGWHCSAGSEHISAFSLGREDGSNINILVALSVHDLRSLAGVGFTPVVICPYMKMFLELLEMKLRTRWLGHISVTG
jgi:hypothetical protein